MNIVVPDYIDISETTKGKLRELGATIYDDVPNEGELIHRVKDAEIITANFLNITKKVIDAAPQLKYIVVPAVGFEWVDHTYAAEKGIKVLNCPTHNGLAVAEYAMGLIFAVQKKIVDAANSLATCAWEPKQFRAQELYGSKLGIIGYGKIGQRIGAMATGIGMEVMGVGGRSSDEEWDQLLRESDVVCMCLPQNRQTFHVLDDEKLRKLKPSAVLINVGRGSTVDTKALLAALSERRLAGAGLDVFEDEPLSGEAGEAITNMANLPNVVATPHTAYSTVQSSERLDQELLANIESCLSGRPMNSVN